MKSPRQSVMRLYSTDGERLYVNASERVAFEKAAHGQTQRKKLFCLVLLYTGCRISEAINLRIQDFQLAEGIVAINSLKKRDKFHVRELPLPKHFTDALANYFATVPSHPQFRPWNIDRSTAWDWVKHGMHEAGIIGMHACPKGLRHGFGVHAVMCNIALSLLQKWMGHASIKTTAIYTQVVGAEERIMAKRMWRNTCL